MSTVVKLANESASQVIMVSHPDVFPRHLLSLAFSLFLSLSLPYSFLFAPFSVSFRQGIHMSTELVAAKGETRVEDFEGSPDPGLRWETTMQKG